MRRVVFVDYNETLSGGKIVKSGFKTHNTYFYEKLYTALRQPKTKMNVFLLNSLHSNLWDINYLVSKRYCEKYIFRNIIFVKLNRIQITETTAKRRHFTI